MHNYAIMHIGAAYLSIHNSARVPSRQEKARDAPYAPFSGTCGKSLSASALRASAVQNVFFRIAEKALPTCRRAFPAARERLFRCKEKALRRAGTGFSASWNHRKGMSGRSLQPSGHAPTVAEEPFPRSSVFYFTKNFCQYFLLSRMHNPKPVIRLRFDYALMSSVLLAVLTKA